MACDVVPLYRVERLPGGRYQIWRGGAESVVLTGSFAGDIAARLADLSGRERQLFLEAIELGVLEAASALGYGSDRSDSFPPGAGADG